MLRIIRKAALDSLHADRAALAQAREELAHAKTEAEQATDSAIRAEATAEQRLTDLYRAQADLDQAERHRDTARTQRDQDRAETNRQLAELREGLAKLREAAGNPETGDTVKAAIAYRVLHDLYADAWREGLLPKRPFDVVAAVLGFDTHTQPQTATAATA